MSGSGLDWATVNACSQKEANDVQHMGAEATPSHEYVPWVLVAERQLQQPNYTLLASICAAYTGPAPASCTEYWKKMNVSFKQ